MHDAGAFISIIVNFVNAIFVDLVYIHHVLMVTANVVPTRSDSYVILYLQLLS